MPTLRESSPPANCKGKSDKWKNPSTGNPLAASAAFEQPQSSGHVSPSHKEVMCDLIDATCHEIILLEGSDPESIAPYASYDVLVGRLDTYMKALDVERQPESQGGGCSEEKTPDDIEAPPDNVPDKSAGTGAGLRCRLLMARLVVNICMRSTYPNSTVDHNQSHQTSSSLPPLIQMTASEWEGLICNLEKVKDMTHQNGTVTGSQYQSLICQIEAMEALAKLRNHLHEAVTEVKQVGTAFNYNNVKDNIDEYRASCNTIQRKLCDIRETRVSGLFIPYQIISSARCTGLEANGALISIVKDIDQIVDEQAFSLQSFQNRLLKILRIWAKSCLMPPTLFEVGYFGHHGDQLNLAVAASPSSPKSPGYTKKHRTVKAATMMGGDCDRSSDSDFSVMDEGCDGDSEPDTEARKRPIKSLTYPIRANRKKRGGCATPTNNKKKTCIQSSREKGNAQPRLNSNQYERPPFTPDVHISNVSKRRRMPKGHVSERIRYTVQEKEALLDGVAKHGVGRWKEIRQEYHDIFEENGRTPVNLKDLYRTLTKKK